MSKRNWTADLHLGHANICAYCRRPWLKPWMITDNPNSNRGFDWVSDFAKESCAASNNAGLINNCNARVCADDQVVHVGDFCCRGSEKGVSGVKTKASEWIEQLNGNWIMIKGNHDDNNGLKRTIMSMTVELGGMYALVQHRPTEWKCEIPDFCHFVICGHVHNAWHTKFINGILHINVGVDANNYYPISDAELICIAERELRNK